MYVVMARTSGRKLPLSRARILKTALEIADLEGIEGLTMRRLGERLRVEAMSLYNHVRNKEDLVDGMVDLVFGEIELPAGGEAWKEAMRRRAKSAQVVLGRHRWAIPLMESRTQPGAANLHHHDSVLRCLREAGLSVELAAHAYSALDSYIYGFALEQASLPFETGEQAAVLAETMLQAFPVNDYPYLAEIAAHVVSQPGYSYSNEFDYGLGLILDGLEAAAQTEKGRAQGPAFSG